ncbi:MAG: hypothetical protein L0323_22805 [Planctomycetes bacterium]|nr:hypothetical protein [Planctomycetota bacterium]
MRHAGISIRFAPGKFTISLVDHGVPVRDRLRMPAAKFLRAVGLTPAALRRAALEMEAEEEGEDPCECEGCRERWTSGDN